ncbi:hypothetical protein HDU87_002474 [Geranomyces variabilis]|uniref:Uncharacterized protein n=1 Tax=Geranomyces variabilis TaxID=109894 RepID=A0AAD5XNT9_9FUNG|nr:hypothetical protein HDU87_002474 [Geranomyces variabilis]
MTDCSCLVSYLLVNSGLGRHFADVPKEEHDAAVQPPMPRAKEYAQFLTSVGKHWQQRRNDGDSPRWAAVESIWALQPGDLVAWEIPDWKAEGKKSTGHVLVVVEPPPLAWAGGRNATLIPAADQTSVWVSVLDSSSIAHQWDLRCATDSTTPSCVFGVGHSFIRLLGNAAGEPTAFQFRDGAAIRAYPISLARVIDEPSWDGGGIEDRSTLLVQRSSDSNKTDIG